MIDQFQIREIQEFDSSEISRLNDQLGYQTSDTLVKKQICSILQDKSHYGFVAIIDHQIVGYIHAFIATRLTTADFIEIGGLVVDEGFRKIGIGRNLVARLEQRISEVETIRVRCNINRNSAHEFYSMLNYEEKKVQKVFERNLLTH